MEVEAILAAQDRVTGPLKAVERTAGGTSRAIEGTERATESLSRGFESLKAKAEILGATLGVGLGLREFKEMFVDTNSQIEDATRALGGMVAGLYQFRGATTPAENLQRAMERSRDMMEGFEASATRTGIPARTLAMAAQQMAPGMAQTRTSTQELVGFTSHLAILSKMVGADTTNSAMAMSEFLQYGMAMRNPLMMQLGLHGQIYAKMTAMQRLALVQKKLQAFGISEETLRQHETLSDKVSRIHAQMELIAERAGRPLFDKASEAASKLAGWLDKNQDKVKAIESEVVDKLVWGFKEAEKVVEFIGDNLETVTHAAEALVAIFAGVKGTKMAAGMAETLSKVGLSAGADMASAFGAAVPAVAIGGAIAEALAAAVHAGWLDKLLGIKVEGIKATTTPEAYQKQLDKVDAYMDDLMKSAEVQRMIAEDRRSGFTKAQAKQDVLNQLSERAARSTIGGAAGLALDAGAVRAYGERRGVFGAPTPPAGPKMPGDRGRDQMNQNFYNARFDIMQQFAPGFDPDRVAVAFTADLAALGDKRTQSSLHPIHGAT